MEMLLEKMSTAKTHETFFIFLPLHPKNSEYIVTATADGGML